MERIIAIASALLSVVVQAHDGDYSSTYGLYCGTTTLDGPRGNFTSPNYPLRYHNRKYCYWDITVREGWVVELTINFYDIGDSEQCSDRYNDYDQLVIYDGFEDSKIATICGTKNTATVLISSVHTMRVYFESDRRGRGNGFTASYLQIRCAAIKKLQQKGDLKWFKFEDQPKSSNLKRALYSGEQSKQVYKGLSKQDATFHVEARSGKEFRLVEMKIHTRYASEIVIVYEYKNKGAVKKKGSSESIENSEEWTAKDMIFGVNNVKRITVTIKWDTSLGKKMKKINVRNFMVTVCEQ